jgi:Phage portal protein
MVIKMPESVRKEAVKDWVEQFRASHEGLANAYKSLVLGGGADVTTVGADFQQMDFKVTQGAGETRIAAAARVHPVIVGLSEGLQGASLNAGNFALARRSFADGTMRPLWRNMAGSLSNIVKVPGGAELWYDDRDIAFLREDEKDAADIQSTRAQTIAALIREGFKPDSVINAVEASDFSRLVHTGLYSVQLQELNPGTTASAVVTASQIAIPNGKSALSALPPAK